jgi:coenzyme F420-0:L-glutamate ligase / coenzyme F420-1:gamma-L-glutamate ligase
MDRTTGSPTPVTLLPVTGIGEIAPADDLADAIIRAVDLRDGDVLVVTSKVVSKAEDRVVTMDKAEALRQETDRVVATRGPTSIVRTRHGLVMANAGIDASNTRTGTVVLLPVDPDSSARAIRERIAASSGPNVAVVVTDTSGRAWRNGQTDIAVGCAGLDVLHDYAGQFDDYGNELEVTAPAIADEIAAAADLVKGKLARVPAAVVRGLEMLVLSRGSHGPGAGALVRDEAGDMFGYGAREAVTQALAGDTAPLRGFGRSCSAEELVAVLRDIAEDVVRSGDDAVEATMTGYAERETGRLEVRLSATARAHGWLSDGDAAAGTVLRFRRGTP